jgi:hypothetical protein
MFGGVLRVVRHGVSRYRGVAYAIHQRLAD